MELTLTPLIIIIIVPCLHRFLSTIGLWIQSVARHSQQLTLQQEKKYVMWLKVTRSVQVTCLEYFFLVVPWHVLSDENSEYLRLGLILLLSSLFFVWSGVGC